MSRSEIPPQAVQAAWHEIPEEIIVAVAKATSGHFAECDHGEQWRDCATCCAVVERVRHVVASAAPLLAGHRSGPDASARGSAAPHSPTEPIRPDTPSPDDSDASERATALRDRIAKALIATIKQSVIVDDPYGPGRIGQPFAATEYDLADAVLAVRDDALADAVRRAEQAEAEVVHLRAGESEHPPAEGTAMTPAEWIRRWNDATRDKRLEYAAIAQDNAAKASACFLLDHEGAVERLAEAEPIVARLRALRESYGRVLARSDDSVLWQVYEDVREQLRTVLDGPGAVSEEQTGDGNG